MEFDRFMNKTTWCWFYFSGRLDFWWLF